VKFPLVVPAQWPPPASAQPSFCAGSAAQKLLIRFGPIVRVIDWFIRWYVRKRSCRRLQVGKPDREGLRYQSISHLRQNADSGSG
jgi:hypothetical protein